VLGAAIYQFIRQTSAQSALATESKVQLQKER